MEKPTPNSAGRWPCACCGYCTLTEPPGSGSFDICAVCGWEDDNVQFQDPTFPGGANTLCLNDARRHFERSARHRDTAVCHARENLPRHGWEWPTPPPRGDRWACACCGYYTLPHAIFDGCYDICPVCYWENDRVQFRDPTYRRGANKPSLDEARREFARTGSSNVRLARLTRRPSNDEGPPHVWVEGAEPQWQAVQLGRDAAIRAFRMSDDGEKLFQCVCCGMYTLSSVDTCDICPDCGWEDWYECHDAPSEVVRPNYISLNDARSVLALFGPAACCEANQSGHISIHDIERMSPSELATLKTMRQRWS
jgi:hypothetical protein